MDQGLTFGLNGLSLEQWIGVGSAGLALASFVFNWLVVQRQSALQGEALKAQMDADLLAWANEAIDTLGRAMFVARGRGAYLSEQELRLQAADVLHQISAAADKGRLFFPNAAHAAFGKDKEGAYQGFRPPVLDALIFAYRRLERMDMRNVEPDLDTADFLMRCRRLLVSEVQEAVDPRRRGRMLALLARTGPTGDPKGYAAALALAIEIEQRFPGLLGAQQEVGWAAAVAQARTQGA